MADRMSCDDCRLTFDAYENELPPCGTELEPDYKKCHYSFVELVFANATAWEVYSTVSDQHIMGSMGPVTLNINAVFNVMDRLKIHKSDQLDLLAVIRKVYGKVIEHARLKKGMLA